MEGQDGLPGLEGRKGGKDGTPGQDLSGAHPVVVLESAPRTTPPSNCTAMIVVWGKEKGVSPSPFPFSRVRKPQQPLSAVP